MEPISLVQPRHSFAPEDGEGHVYMPTSLLTVGSRLIQAGIDVEFQDGNLRPLSLDRRFIGVNLLGAPYIPEVREKIMRLLHPDQVLIAGGQVTTGLTVSQFSKLFGHKAIRGNNDEKLGSALGCEHTKMRRPQETSLIPAYEKISAANLCRYMVQANPKTGAMEPREMSFYLSQGCGFNCAFCAAQRAQKETYRTMGMTPNEDNIVAQDLEYLVHRAKEFGVQGLELYLSNLDLFQKPYRLKRFAEIVLDIKRRHPGFTIGMRALSTAKHFVHWSTFKPKIVQSIVDAGLHTVGFGIDGSSSKTWAEVGKEHNTRDNCIRAIRIAQQEYGMTPEALMVFGHAKENESDIRRDEEFSRFLYEQYGAVPRPHIAKDLIPGNLYWLMRENKTRVDFLMRNPEYFQSNDFTALASSVSHPIASQRRAINTSAIRVSALDRRSTKLVEARDPEVSEKENAARMERNIGNYDR